jgi:hypothetical protein
MRKVYTERYGRDYSAYVVPMYKAKPCLILSYTTADVSALAAGLVAGDDA